MKFEDPDVDQLDQEWANDSRPDGRAIKVREVPSIFSLDQQPIIWAVDRVLAIGAVTMISGDSGLLKSTLLTAAGRCIADGTEFAGLLTTRREVLILDRGENTLGIVQERFRRLGIKDGNGLRHYGGWLGDVPAPGSPLVMEYVTATNPKPMIIVDSLISFIDGDENSAVEMRAFMRQPRQLASLGAGVVVIHHSGKAESSKQYRGSSDIKASVDVAYEVEGLGDPTRLERLILKAFKSRFATRQRLSLRFDGSQFFFDEPAGPTKSNREKLRDLLIANPAIKAAGFYSLSVARGLGRDRARAFLTEGRTNGVIRVTPGPNNAQFHTWIGLENGTQNGSGSL